MLDFLFLDLGKTAAVAFVRAPLDFRQYLTKRLFGILYKNAGTSSKPVFFLICLPPGRRLVPDAGDGDGGVASGTIREHFRSF